MNKRRIWAVMLCVIGLMSCAPAAWAQGMIRVACISNMAEMSDLALYVTGGDVYIRAEDAQQLSGFKAGGQAEFFRAGLRVDITSGLVIDNTYWLPLEDTLRRLKTQVDQVGGGLVFTGRKTLPQELFAKTDRYMDNREAFNLVSGNRVLIAGGVLASMYHRLTSFSLAQTLTGAYDRKMYADLLGDILRLKEEHPMLKPFKQSTDITKILTKLKAAEFGLENPKDEDWMRLYAEGKIGDAGMVMVAYGNVMDPVSYLMKRTGSEETLKGLDVHSQLKLMDDIRSMIACEELAANMLLLTYAQDALPSGVSIGDYVPDAAVDAIDDVRTFVQDMDHVDALIEVLQEEAELALFSTVHELVNKAAMGKTPKLAGNAPKLAAKAMGKAIDAAMPDAASGMDYMEKLLYLSRLQEKLPALYDVYRGSTLSVVNAKYTTMLYLRIMQTAYELCVEEGVIEADEAFMQDMDDALAALASVSDAELRRGDVVNDRIDVQALIPIESGSLDVIPQLREYAEKQGATNAVLCDLDFDGEPELVTSSHVGVHMGFSCEIVDVEDGELLVSYEGYNIPLGDSLRLYRRADGTLVWFEVFEEAYQGEFVRRVSRLTYDADSGVMQEDETNEGLEEIRAVNMVLYSFPDQWIEAVEDYQTLEAAH